MNNPTPIELTERVDHVGFVYLASPYSHKDKAVVELRVQEVIDYAAALTCENWKVFSPIAHNHSMALRHQLPTDAEFWWNYNRAFLKSCWALVVCDIPGWDISAGVRKEIDYVRDRLHKPIYFVTWKINGTVRISPFRGK